MLFQLVDDKKFVGVYADGAIHRASLPEGLSKTWRHCSYLGDADITYASLYCGGKSLGDVCPKELLPRWEHVSEEIKAHFHACRQAKIDLHARAFLDLVPEKLLTEFFEIKNRITEHVLATYPKPANYDFLLDLEKLLHDIRHREINLNLDALKPHLTTVQARASYRRLQGVGRVIDYDAHRTKTGRLTTKRGSFPILTLNKQFRCAIEPVNDYFLELDFNAAELRTLLALSDKQQPDGDIHEWNTKNVYQGQLTREESKKRVFAWLYNPGSKDQLSSKAYSRDEVLKKYYNGSQVTTFFDRVIPADDHHALNYIVQSTTSDLLLRRAIKIDKMLKERKSYIAFTLHDSLVIDFAEEDRGLLKQIVDTFKDTDLGSFVANISVGKSFGDLRRLKI